MEKVTPRERVLATINRQPVDRTPVENILAMIDTVRSSRIG